jgi:hypothetical protein
VDGETGFIQKLDEKQVACLVTHHFICHRMFFYLIRVTIGDGSVLEMTSEEVTFLFSTSIIPPLPQYIISAGSSAVVVLVACLYFSERFSESNKTSGCTKQDNCL